MLAPEPLARFDGRVLTEALREQMLERIALAEIADGDGRPVRFAPAPLVIGRVADSEPLVTFERALATLRPERILRGLSAAALLCGASRALLLVSVELEAMASRRLAHMIPARAPLIVESLAAVHPLTAEDIRADLLERPRFDLPAQDVGAAPVFDAGVLDAVAAAVYGEAQHPLLGVSGVVREPRVMVIERPLTVEEVVERCGGCEDLGWVAYAGGVSAARQAERGQIVDARTRALVILPHDHELRVRWATPVADLRRRAQSACSTCRQCSDVCPAHLRGTGLSPHELWHKTDLPAALACSACGLCDAACPSGIEPMRWVLEQAAEARARHMAPPVAGARHPGWAERRVPTMRLAEQLGLSGR